MAQHEQKPRLSTKLLSHSIRLLLSILMRTIRWQHKGMKHLSSSTPCLICSWHNQLAMNGYYLKSKHIACTMVASQHRDGELIASIMASWGFPLIRGSTQSKGALEVTKKMLSLLKQANAKVAMTSDGPRGPKYQAKPGAIRIARQCGADILMMHARPSRFWQLNTWDNFIIPKPFTKITIVIEKLDMPSSLKDHQDITALVNEKLNQI